MSILDNRRQVVVSISYQRNEADKVLMMEDWLMSHYGYNRSQLHKQLVRKEYQTSRMLWNERFEKNIAKKNQSPWVIDEWPWIFRLPSNTPDHIPDEWNWLSQGNVNADWCGRIFFGRGGIMSNPFHNFKNQVAIAMLLEICRKKRVKPEQLLEAIIKLADISFQHPRVSQW